MKKIVFVIESLQYGGAERVLTGITDYLAEHDYDITVITFLLKEQEYELNQKIKRINLNIPNNGVQKLIYGVKKLKEALLLQEAQICIAFDILANILLLLAAPHSMKVVISERNAPKQTALSIYSKILRFLIYPKSDYYVFQTKEAASYYSKKIQMKSTIIPNPILSQLPKKKYVDLNKEVVAIGRLEKQKNYELMLRSFKEFLKEHEDYTLSIYGIGSEQDNLNQLCRQLDISHQVVFRGNSNKVHEMIIKAEIFLMTSSYEGIPNALMEAMAMGFPVIATNCPAGGVALLIEDGKNGILVDGKDEKKIGHALSCLVENPAYAEQLGISASCVRQRFSLEIVGSQWENMIEQIWNDKGKL